MRSFLGAFLLGSILLGCLAGCAVRNQGNGSFFLTYGTTLEFGMRTQVATPEQVSELEVDFDGLFGAIQEFYSDGPVDE